MQDTSPQGLTLDTTHLDTLCYATCDHVGLRWGLGIWTDGVVKHEVIPAYSREPVGITMKPTHTFSKVLVSPISESVGGKKKMQLVYCLMQNTRVTKWTEKTHISCCSEFITAREQSSLTEASKGTLGWMKKNCWFIRRRQERKHQKVHFGALNLYLFVEKARLLTLRLCIFFTRAGSDPRKSLTDTLPISSPERKRER